MEFEGKTSDLKSEKYGFSFEPKRYTTSGWARGGVRMWSALKIRRGATLHPSWNNFDCKLYGNTYAVDVTVA